jgi:GH15 family glucan-1,4-alpha-glucosidase
VSALIEDYALIGNTHTAALVGRNGSIDWLCLPTFSSPACFAGLLGDEGNGRFLLAPAGGLRRVERAYREDSLILETRFETDDGVVELVDFMPSPRPDGITDIVRIVRGRGGVVPMRLALTLRLEYGSVLPWVQVEDHKLHAFAGPDAFFLYAPIPLSREHAEVRAEFAVAAGGEAAFVLTRAASYRPEPAGRNAHEALARTEAFWRRWGARMPKDGPYAPMVRRSAITLKALTFNPTGGIVAAATASLPESLGGPRNWDYRFCWLRDATFTLYALGLAGFRKEARAWRDWLCRAVGGEPGRIQIMYGLGGERTLEEREVPWLAGYAGSRPVRFGNAAYKQCQIDVYGEVMDALHLSRAQGFQDDVNSWGIQRGLMDFLEGGWDGPDSGLWEERSGPRPHIFSQVMAWVAADRAVKAVERFGREGPADRWRALRARIHEHVCRKGYNEKRQAFVQSYDTEKLDASLLLLPLVGFLSPHDERVVNTVRAIERELTVDGFVKRYEADGQDGLHAPEGAFLACTFWLADNYALVGHKAKAAAIFERVAGVANDVGLLAEEYDTKNRRLIGNFPQAFSHVGLINTAHNLLAAGPARHRAKAAGNPFCGNWVSDEL